MNDVTVCCTVPLSTLCHKFSGTVKWCKLIQQLLATVPQGTMIHARPPTVPWVIRVPRLPATVP